MIATFILSETHGLHVPDEMTCGVADDPGTGTWET
jgi:hypothetical protein